MGWDGTDLYWCDDCTPERNCKKHDPNFMCGLWLGIIIMLPFTLVFGRMAGVI